MEHEEPKAHPAQDAGRSMTLRELETIAEGYYFGDAGYSKDLKEAIVWLKKAADAGSPECAHNLAMCYYNGTGCERNYAKAAHYFACAAKEGNGVLASVYNLGVCYERGEGVEQDMNQAIHHYKLAADRGHPKADHNLRVLLKPAFTTINVRANPQTGRLLDVYDGSRKYEDGSRPPETKYYGKWHS